MSSIYMATQPWLLPPVYILERMARCDHVVLLTEAQFDRHHVRPKFSPHGQDVTFSPPVMGSHRSSFDDVKMDGADFAKRLEKTIQHSYRKEPGFAETEPTLAQLFFRMGKWETVAQVCAETMLWSMEQAGLKVPLLPARLLVKRQDDASMWLADLGTALLATDYLQGKTGADGYLQVKHFEKRKIGVWLQVYNRDYDVTVSGLDFLLRNGKAALRDAIDCKTPGDSMIRRA